MVLALGTTAVTTGVSKPGSLLAIRTKDLNLPARCSATGNDSIQGMLLFFKCS